MREVILKHPWRTAAVLAAPFTISLTALIAVLVLSAWSDCAVGINAGANSVSFAVFYAPPLVVGLQLAFMLPFRAVARRSFALAVVVGLFAVAMVAYTATSLATPDGLSDVCANSVPAWWPTWLPT